MWPWCCLRCCCLKLIYLKLNWFGEVAVIFFSSFGSSIWVSLYIHWVPVHWRLMRSSWSNLCSCFVDAQKPKEHDERLRLAQARVKEIQRRKVEELRESIERSEECCRKKEDDRRKRIEEMKQRDGQRRANVEERKKKLVDEENVRKCFYFVVFFFCAHDICSYQIWVTFFIRWHFQIYFFISICFEIFVCILFCLLRKFV